MHRPVYGMWKLATGTICFIILVSMTALYIAIHDYVLTAIFMLLSVLYIYLNLDLVTIVTLNEFGVEKRVIPFRRVRYSWCTLVEVGVMYMNPISRRKKNKRLSACRIYLSPRKLTQEERLRVGLQCPADLITLQYSPKRLRLLTGYWNGILELFNISAKELFGDTDINFDGCIHESSY